MLVVIIYCCAAWHNGTDVFCLHLLEEANDVLGDVLAECENGAVTYGSVGAQESCDGVS